MTRWLLPLAYAACSLVTGIGDLSIGAGAPDAGEGASIDSGPVCEAGAADCSGGCVDLQSDRMHCGDCAHACGVGEMCRAGTCGKPRSCRDVLALQPGTPSGLQSLEVWDAMLPFYCDMELDGGGWTLLYRVSRGVAGDAYALFGSPANDDVPEEATPLATTKHYASRLLANWGNTFPVEAARVHLYGDDDKVARALAFDARNSTATSWFTPQRLTASPWTDVKAAVKFSIDPPSVSPRTILIHGPYDGCNTDSGWLVVQSTAASVPCAWENPYDTVRIFYSTVDTVQGWNAQHGEAKSFAVFVR